MVWVALVFQILHVFLLKQTLYCKLMFQMFILKENRSFCEIECCNHNITIWRLHTQVYLRSVSHWKYCFLILYFISESWNQSFSWDDRDVLLSFTQSFPLKSVGKLYNVKLTKFGLIKSGIKFRLLWKVFLWQRNFFINMYCLNFDWIFLKWCFLHNIKVSLQNVCDLDDISHFKDTDESVWYLIESLSS